mmetsp:Transcript_3462/g.8268  ORF Transcript_3462/g.8268 Transcript_3462/m.8268 type:complete len:397 (-) Transcript_3462:585-1775(-)
MVHIRGCLWLLLACVHTSTQHISSLDLQNWQISSPKLRSGLNLKLRGGAEERQQASTLSEAGWTRISGVPAQDNSERNDVFGGGWYIEEGISGHLGHATFVLKTERNLAALEQRGRILLVAGGPWEFERCEMWAEWAGIALCVGSSSVVFNSSSLGGTASKPESRCGDILTAWDNASCVLTHSVLQRSTGFGGRWHDHARGALYGCVISECEVGLGLGDASRVRVEATLVRENVFGSFAATANAQGALLEVLGCRLGPSHVTSGPSHVTAGPSHVDTGPAHVTTGLVDSQWASEDRPGEVVGERNSVEEEEEEAQWTEMHGHLVPREYAELVALRDKAMNSYEKRAKELLPQMEANLARLKAVYAARSNPTAQNPGTNCTGRVRAMPLILPPLPCE